MSTQAQFESDGSGPVVPSSWRPSIAEPVPVVRCTTIKKNGERCKRYSLRGTTVCIVHGGRLPNVQAHANAVVESARLRLIGMTDLAIDQLEDLMQNAPQEMIRLKAAQDVLDRAGIRGGIELDVAVTHEVKAVDRVQDRLRQISDRMTPKEDEAEDDESIVDVEVIEVEDNGS